MTNSRSTASRSSRLAVLLLCVFATVASAGRKRVVVLDFEGPKAEKFHDDVVKLIKAKNTVIPSEKWATTADELDAAGSSEKNLKKVAKKLKIDVIVTGKIDKRRDEYLITLKVRGADGAVVNSVNTKSGASHVDGGASKDLNTELVPAIEQIGGGGGGGDDDDKPLAKKASKKKADADEDDEKPAKKPVKKVAKADDDDDEKPVKKPVKKAVVEDDDEKPAKKGFGASHKMSASDDEDEKPAKKPLKKGAAIDDEDEKPAKKAVVAKKSSDDEDEQPAKKKKASDDEDDKDEKPKKKKVASEEDGEPETPAGDDDEGAKNPLSPGNRALDARFGLSFIARRMSFTYKDALGSSAPPGYKGVPSPGLYLDATLFPGAINHAREGIAKDLGIRLMVDKAVLLSSQVTPPGGMATKLDTSMTHYEFGVVYRHAFGKDASAPVFLAELNYGGQSYSISPTSTVTAAIIDIPNVSYKMIVPTLGLKYPATPKITLDVSFGLQVITGEGDIVTSAQYGSASVLGVAGELGLDYLATKNVFIRAAFRFNTIGYTFKGDGMMATMRDGNADQDVFGARDTYIGGAVTAGYLY